MRKIVFRIKDIDIWYYGFPLREVRPKDLYIPFQGEDENGNSFYSISVDVKTLGQFTGFYDKNGKEIYEGDIVKPNEGEILGVVEWFDELVWDSCGSNHPGFYCKQWLMFGDELNWSLGFNGCEVIGNIYDNPELLKGE